MIISYIKTNKTIRPDTQSKKLLIKKSIIFQIFNLLSKNSKLIFYFRL